VSLNVVFGILIKNLSRGCAVYFPVFVEGANLSVGDMHFSQGDGEVSFCGAIEMPGFLELRCTVIKGGMEMLPAVGPSPLSVNPIFEIGPLEPRYSEWLVFEGISVDEKGVQHYLGKSILMHILEKKFAYVCLPLSQQYISLSFRCHHCLQTCRSKLHQVPC
jgi:acetamidase/formamidase